MLTCDKCKKPTCETVDGKCWDCRNEVMPFEIRIAFLVLVLILLLAILRG
jgi:hypothetical protein